MVKFGLVITTPSPGPCLRPRPASAPASPRPRPPATLPPVSRARRPRAPARARWGSRSPQDWSAAGSKQAAGERGGSGEASGGCKDVWKSGTGCTEGWERRAGGHDGAICQEAYPWDPHCPGCCQAVPCGPLNAESRVNCAGGRRPHLVDAGGRRRRHGRAGPRHHNRPTRRGDGLEAKGAGVGVGGWLGPAGQPEAFLR